jgi:hypothetical protein
MWMVDNIIYNRTYMRVKKIFKIIIFTNTNDRWCNVFVIIYKVFKYIIITQLTNYKHNIIYKHITIRLFIFTKYYYCLSVDGSR